MTPETPHVNSTLSSLTNETKIDAPITPILSGYMLKIFGYVNTFFLTILFGSAGVITNTVNISVFLKMGLSGTTNISFFALSIIDLLVSLTSVVIKITYNSPFSGMKLPSGVPVSEIGLGALFIFYPCLGCSAWITASLCIERCLCVCAPLKVKEILTTKKITFLLLIMAAYQSVYIFLLYMYPGPPYNIPNQWRALFFNCSFSFPSFISFFLVLVSTTVLVVRLKQNLEWRNEAAKQSNQSSGGSKERKAARCVVAICTIFIICFTPNIVLFVMSLGYPTFAVNDPYLGNLKKLMYALSSLFQVVSSSVNIIVYYRMGTKYREVFTALFCRKKV